jgi:hypothetical protein
MIKHPKFGDTKRGGLDGWKPTSDGRTPAGPQVIFAFPSITIPILASALAQVAASAIYTNPNMSAQALAKTRL